MKSNCCGQEREGKFCSECGNKLTEENRFTLSHAHSLMAAWEVKVRVRDFESSHSIEREFIKKFIDDLYNFVHNEEYHEILTLLHNLLKTEHPRW